MISGAYKGRNGRDQLPPCDFKHKVLLILTPYLWAYPVKSRLIKNQGYSIRPSDEFFYSLKAKAAVCPLQRLNLRNVTVPDSCARGPCSVGSNLVEVVKYFHTIF